jgi:thiamine-monophosphate kinase
LATRGGEDYELLFTVPEGKWAPTREALTAMGGQVQAIGQVLPTDGAPSIYVIGLDGVARPESPGAFDHFAQGG